MDQFQESPNALFRRFVQAISDADCHSLRDTAQEQISINVPGAPFVDITAQEHGAEALCKWAHSVRDNCGTTTFALQTLLEDGRELMANGRELMANGRELMANGSIRIDRAPHPFESPCSFHVRFESGKVAAFQLLFDTYALQKFRGETV